jgi:hypothetical protein
MFAHVISRVHKSLNKGAVGFCCCSYAFSRALILTALVCKLVDRCKEPAYSSLSQDRFLTRAVEDTKRTDKKLQDLYVEPPPVGERGT